MRICSINWSISYIFRDLLFYPIGDRGRPMEYSDVRRPHFQLSLVARVCGVCVLHCIVHISETNIGRDLIFGTSTPLNLDSNIIRSSHQVVPLPQAAPPTCQNLTLTISQRLLFTRHLIFGTYAL